MKITREQSKAHDDALAILSLCRTLTYDEVEFVMEHYNPMATHNVTKGGIYFTPLSLAIDIAQIGCMSDGGMVVDIAAGIGRLSYGAIQRHRWDKMPIHVTAIEIDPEFVEVGKKLLPEVEWVCDNIFEQSVWDGQMFDIALSNPPFGNIGSKDIGSWLNYQGACDLMAVELAARYTRYGGTFVLPSGSVPADAFGFARGNDDPMQVRRFKKKNPNVMIIGTSLEGDFYKDQWVGTSPSVKIVDVKVDENA